MRMQVKRHDVRANAGKIKKAGKNPALMHCFYFPGELLGPLEKFLDLIPGRLAGGPAQSLRGKGSTGIPQ
jgi:hypothetical protein